MGMQQFHLNSKQKCMLKMGSYAQDYRLLYDLTLCWKYPIHLGSCLNHIWVLGCPRS